MSTPVELHSLARKIFSATLEAVHARFATCNAIEVRDGKVFVLGSLMSAKPLYAVSIGKAAVSMAMGVDDSVGSQLSEGIVVGPEDSNYSKTSLTNWKLLTGGHPLPDQNSLNSAAAVFELLEKANAERATVIFLVSGGGSAMIEWPISSDISLDDLRKANRTLVSSGASISEINSVRRAFSAVKGGGLARVIPDAAATTLIVSDTNQGDEASVASGPTLPPPANVPTAIDVISRYNLQDQLPESILSAVARTQPHQRIKSSPHHVLLENQSALIAAAEEAVRNSFVAEIDVGVCEQPVQEGCELLLNKIQNRKSRFCLISGGEFSCPVRGNGMGGRNLETVLTFAIELDRKRLNAPVAFLSCGSDGIDGNSPAAGAIADNNTISRARELGLNAAEYLARSDSYSFFEKLGDLVTTGPTGTNVRDVRVLLRA